MVLALSQPAWSDGNPDVYQRQMTAGRTSQRNGDNATALTDFLSALAQYPSSDLPRTSVLSDLLSSSPTTITLTALHTVSPDITPFDIHVSGDSNSVIVVPKLRGSEMEVKDPQCDWPFDETLLCYRFDNSNPDLLTLVCRLHYQTPDDQDLAEHVGHLLTLLRNALSERTGQIPISDTIPFDVYLCRRAPGPGGGEQWENNIYFYNVTDSRSSIEWIREIAHEYSHLAFPAVGGDYTAPEEWANGYMGERLLVRWLSRGASGGPAEVEKAWGKTFSGYANFDRLLIEPALALYKKVGPSTDYLNRTDELGMRYAIGLLLNLDDVQGPKAVGTLLWNMKAEGETKPVHLLDAANMPTKAPSSPPLASP